MAEESAKLDKQLIERALLRRKGGATGLVARYRPSVEGRLRLLTRDPELARDLAQDTFLQAFRDLPRLSDVTRFGAWLMIIAWRTYRAWLRSATERVARRSACVAPEDMDQMPPPLSDPTGKSAERTELWRAVEKVAEPYRMTLVQRYRLDLSLNQIAASQGIGLSLAKFRLRRGHELLKELMAPAAHPAR